MLRLAMAALAVAAMLWPAAAGASGHSAVRSFAAPQVAPGGTLEVTVEAANLGGFGQVTETLPAGFAYVGSDLPSGVEVSGNTVSFLLLGANRVTYTVTAPAAEGTYAFAGVVRDSERAEERVGGATSVRVGQPPTALPTATPMPTATPIPAPTPTPTAMPAPRRPRCQRLHPYRQQRQRRRRP